MPSTSTRMPFGAFAIWRTIATVPTRCRSSGAGSSASVRWSSSSTMRSPASARLMASTDIGAAHAERRNRQWQHHRAADRDDGKFGGQRERRVRRMLVRQSAAVMRQLQLSAGASDLLTARLSDCDSQYSPGNHPPADLLAVGARSPRPKICDEAALFPRDRDRQVERW